jgi:hypothetical protein
LANSHRARRRSEADAALAWSDGPSGGEIAGAVVLFAIQIVTAIPFFILTIFTSMAVAGCSERQCNFVVAAAGILGLVLNYLALN